MSNRSARENSDSISLFPFLAVLLCTMGALLVLLVILVQRAAEYSLLPPATTQESGIASGPALAPPPVDAAEQIQLQKELAEITAYQKQLDELQAEGLRRLEDERLRLSHSEDHTRRLEEELAKLSIAAEQLKQTESDQSVDQKQAEEELARLEKLVVDTEEQLEALREAPSKKSYAIVPYKGRNGTYRKPIYLECTAKEIIIHPEGIKLTAKDFIAPNWPGNPLAAALRASREYLNDKAAQAGEPEPPDPYPLIIVRPSGVMGYNAARKAITSWDSDYGYEFVDEDMKLAFPEGPDPQLAQVQYHAIMIARERLSHLVQSAPSRFPGVHIGESTNGPGSSGGSGGANGNGEAAGTGTEGEGGFAGSDEWEQGSGGGGWGGDEGDDHLAGDGSAGQDNPQFGAMGDAGANGEADSSSGERPGGSTNGIAQDGSAGDSSLVGSRYAQQGNNTNAANGGTTNAPSEPLHGKDQPNGGSQQMAGSSAGATSGGSGANQPSMSGGTPGTSFSANQSNQTIAESRGANWAVNQPQQKSMAIRRSIHVVVRENKMILMPSVNGGRGEVAGQEISLDQPVEDISDEFATAVKVRIEDWGLAGSGMYWKPVLELNVDPAANMTANRISHLLKNSGVEVQLPETARNSSPQPGGTVR